MSAHYRIVLERHRVAKIQWNLPVGKYGVRLPDVEYNHSSIPMHDYYAIIDM